MLAIQVFGEFRIVPAKRRRHVTLEMGLCKNKTRKEKVLGTSRINQVVNLGGARKLWQRIEVGRRRQSTVKRYLQVIQIIYMLG